MPALTQRLENMSSTYSQADMFHLSNNCGFIHRSMKSGTHLNQYHTLPPPWC